MGIYVKNIVIRAWLARRRGRGVTAQRRDAILGNR